MPPRHPRPATAAMIAPVQPCQSMPTAWSSDHSPGPIMAMTKRGDGDRRAVLPALVGLEDEEADLPVGDDDRDRHDADHAGGGERREEADCQQHAAADLGGRRQARLPLRPAHADAVEPAGRAGEPAGPEELVVAVIGEEQTEHDAQNQHAGVELVHGPNASGKTRRDAIFPVDGRIALIEPIHVKGADKTRRARLFRPMPVAAPRRSGSFAACCGTTRAVLHGCRLRRGLRLVHRLLVGRRASHHRQAHRPAVRRGHGPPRRVVSRSSAC